MFVVNGGGPESGPLYLSAGGIVLLLFADGPEAILILRFLTYVLVDGIRRGNKVLTALAVGTSVLTDSPGVSGVTTLTGTPKPASAALPNSVSACRGPVRCVS